MNSNFNILDMQRVKDILAKEGVSTPADYLIKRGLIPTKDWGWVKSDRLDYCLKRGVIRASDGEDSYSIIKDCGITPSRLLKFLNGEIDDLRGNF